MKARDIMTRHPTVVRPTDSIAHAASMMQERDVGIIPVEHLVEHISERPAQPR